MDHDGLIGRSMDHCCKVDLLREKIEIFLKLDLFGSIAMDLHIGLSSRVSYILVRRQVKTLKSGIISKRMKYR